MGMVSSSDTLRAPERPTAIATLNRQRHLTPSCGGLTPTAGLLARENISEINGASRLCPHWCPNWLLPLTCRSVAAGVGVFRAEGMGAEGAAGQSRSYQSWSEVIAAAPAARTIGELNVRLSYQR